MIFRAIHNPLYGAALAMVLAGCTVVFDKPERAYPFDSGEGFRPDSLKGRLCVNFTPDQVVAHPRKDLLFALKKNSGTIAVIDFADRKLVRYIYQDEGLGFIDIKCLEQKCLLFVPKLIGGLAIYDADDFRLLKTIATLPFSVPAYSVAVNDQGKAFVSTFTISGTVYDAVKDTVLPGGAYERERIVVNPSGSDVIGMPLNSSPADLHFFTDPSDGSKQKTWSGEYRGAHPLDPGLFKLIPRKDILITGSQGAMYRADTTLAFVGLLPEYRDSLDRPINHYSDFDFSENGDTLFAAASDRIVVYGLPKFEVLYSVPTAGAPAFIVKRGRRIICLSAQTYLEESVYLEIVTIKD